MNTIEELDKKECCGCSSCVQKCPASAISMVSNEEGFLYPLIDKEKCINCGLCSKVCPQLKEIKKQEEEYPKAYAMYNKNEEELLKSSSGGIFSCLANYVLENGGAVFGAAYDDELNVNHIKIESKEDLNKLRSSKYVQSNINNTYKEAEKLLKENRMVLFSGTPCQISGLNSFLLKKYDNLITCDLVCHGVPSNKLFKKYLNYLGEKFGSKVVEYNFRSKEKKGWGLVSKIVTEDGKIRFVEPDFDPYYSNFLKSNIYRESCYNCHYTNYNRVSDITLADYWGISAIHPEFYSKNGRSLILINNKKAEDLIQIFSSDNKLEKLDTDINFASSKNQNLKQPSNRNKVRDTIYKNIDSKDDFSYIKEDLKVEYSLKKVVKSLIPTRLKNFLKKLRGKLK